MKQIEPTEPLPRWIAVAMLGSAVIGTIAIASLVLTGAPVGLLAVIPLLVGTVATPMFFRSAARQGGHSR